ncbi:MAG TPA: NADPH:quinone oxidoreductase family protein [Candidatus Limnocylindrales bacterium]|nr:NADPH:quinone oxidoreductase family protein [Candidatus Limnocylindrales bacterium]
MRAWQVQRLGEPEEALALSDVDIPEPQDGQVLVKVKAVALNFPDVLMCRGQYQIRPQLPFTPGVELCGELVGSPGSTDRVIGSPVLPAGALAEYTLMNEAEILPAPPSLDDAEASSFLIAYQTGWFGLHRRARLQAGETLLVHAAAGGVGSAAVQLGKAAGARVIAVVGGPEKAEVARALGADVVIDRRAQDFVATVKEVTKNRGADVIYDPVGGDAYTGSTKCVAFEGRILVIGFAGGSIPAPMLSHALIKNYSIVGLHWGLYRQYDPQSIVDAHHDLMRLNLKPLVGGRFPLEQAAEGLTRLAKGDSVGRLVVEL